MRTNSFAKQIKWLTGNTLLFSEDDLLSCYKDGHFVSPKTSKPCVMITIDDDYRDFYALAYPVLTQFNTPAVLFAASQMINSRQVPWWDAIAYLIKCCAKPAIHFGGQEITMGNQKQSAIDLFLLRMKKGPYEHTRYLLNDLSEACEVDFPDPELQNGELSLGKRSGKWPATTLPSAPTPIPIGCWPPSAQVHKRRR